MDDTSIGASYLHDFDNIDVCSEKKYSFSFCPKSLVPGMYNVLLVIYRVNEHGEYYDYDAIYPAFAFSIIDNNNTIKIDWDYRNWGRINFGTLKQL